MTSSDTNGLRAALAAAGRRFYERGWVMGTSGNFSAVLTTEPLRLIVTPSAAHKGALTPDQFLEVDERGWILDGPGRPSAETRLHLEIVQRRDARVVLHTHSVWSTILSDLHADAGGFTVSGYEMLKGLDGVTTHEHAEWIPIVSNDQDMGRLGDALGAVLAEHPRAHAVLIDRHGLYTWGQSLAAAERHVEILEFLLEAVGRTGERRHGTRENSR